MISIRSGTVNDVPLLKTLSNRTSGCGRSAQKGNDGPSPISLRVRRRGQMPHAQSGRIHIAVHLQVGGRLSPEVAGNYFLLSVAGGG
jgi:hypothetical protein